MDTVAGCQRKNWLVGCIGDKLVLLPCSVNCFYHPVGRKETDHWIFFKRVEMHPQKGYNLYQAQTIHLDNF